ncbi:MAG: glycosyltransferase [Thermoanaerobaculia bacterium]
MGERMRVLVANIPLPSNRFLVDLNTALARHCDVTHSSDEFWNRQGDYDVIHLHFPEYMTFELQDAYRDGLTDSLIEATKSRLEFWARRAIIVVTRHVLLPHDALSDPQWERMYEAVYAHADGVAHFGKPSIEEFNNRYRDTNFFRAHRPQHVVIPHQNYASLPYGISRNAARAQLRIPSDARVMLVFGAIRNDRERGLIMTTFNALPGRNVLLASKWRETSANVSWIRLQRWIRNVRRLRYRLGRRYRFNYSFVEENDAQKYLAAADVLFIPRLRVLNSGNITLGMTFGVVVVGPDSLDVGELLKSTGNPVFDPADPSTASTAVTEGFRLAAEGKRGPANRALALSEWDTDHCAALYVQFFRELTARTSAKTF